MYRTEFWTLWEKARVGYFDGTHFLKDAFKRMLFERARDSLAPNIPQIRHLFLEGWVVLLSLRIKYTFLGYLKTSIFRAVKLRGMIL